MTNCLAILWVGASGERLYRDLVIGSLGIHRVYRSHIEVHHHRVERVELRCKLILLSLSQDCLRLRVDYRTHWDTISELRPYPPNITSFRSH
jgi:hypothetical protein